MSSKRSVLIIISVLLAITITSALLIQTIFPNTNLRAESDISIDNIQVYLEEQLNLGFRIPGTTGAMNFWDWIEEVASPKPGWNLQTLNFTFDDMDLKNFLITGTELAADSMPYLLIGAHWDTRALADKEGDPDPDPVPGANDAASGVAAILEMMDQIPDNFKQYIGFVLFDAEDQGSLNVEPFDNWNWIIGSNKFVTDLSSDQIQDINAFVLLDMIGDDDIRIPYERGSFNANPALVDEIWDLGDSLGYGDIFVKEPGPSLIDDHRPFLNRGIPAVDIIDFTYPEHHMENDDLDHVSAENIAIVTDVVLSWATARIANDFSIEPMDIPTTADLSSTDTGSETSSSENSDTPSSTNSISTQSESQPSQTTDDSTPNSSDQSPISLFSSFVALLIVPIIIRKVTIYYHLQSK